VGLFGGVFEWAGWRWGGKVGGSGVVRVGGTGYRGWRGGQRVRIMAACRGKAPLSPWVLLLHAYFVYFPHPVG